MLSISYMSAKITIVFFNNKTDYLGHISEIYEFDNIYSILMEYVDSLEGLPEMINLTTLSINSSPNLRSLKGLNLSFPNLKIINIYDTGITNLKYFPVNLPSVEYITINYTQITNLHGFGTTFPKLRNLMLTHNHLKTLSGIPPDLPYLYEISISENQLTDFRNFPNNTPKLEIVNAQNNKITSLSALPFINSLKIFRLSYNNLTSLDKIYYKTPNLKELHFAFNLIKKLQGYQLYMLMKRAVVITNNNPWSYKEHHTLPPLIKLSLDDISYYEAKKIYPIKKYYKLCERCHQKEIVYKKYFTDRMGISNQPIFKIWLCSYCKYVQDIDLDSDSDSDT